MDFTRASQDGGDQYQAVPLHTLTTRQRSMAEAIDAFQTTTGEACTARYLARRFRLNESTVREHLSALYRKGWLRAPNSPAFLTRSTRS